MRARSVLLLVTAGLLLPGAADARKITYGSTLKGKPAITEIQDAETAFWPIAGPAGRSVRAPATGQILSIRLKGTALRSQGQDPRSEFHFQHLRPVGGGRMQVSQTTQAFQIPVGGARGTITTYIPQNLCVRRGDVIAFNDEGGFAPPAFPVGAPYRIFAAAKRARTARFTMAGATFNGATLTPTVRAGEELLMRLTLGTGPQEGVPCRNFNASG